MKGVIARLKGGLGNQLFIYAAALEFAEKLNAELKLDIYSGFWNDKYKRHFELNLVGIKHPALNVFQSVLIKLVVRFPILQKMFACLVLTEKNYERSIVNLKKYRFLILDDYFQCEKFFNSVGTLLKSQIRIELPHDLRIRQISEKIEMCNAVCIHGRLLRAYASDGNKVSDSDPRTVGKEYFKQAIEKFKERLTEPHFFIFSDKPEEMIQSLELTSQECTLITHKFHQNSEVDLALMMKCRHFIIPNSTYSWWAAWLSRKPDTCISVPDAKYWDNPCLIEIGRMP